MTQNLPQGKKIYFFSKDQVIQYDTASDKADGAAMKIKDLPFFAALVAGYGNPEVALDFTKTPLDAALCMPGNPNNSLQFFVKSNLIHHDLSRDFYDNASFMTPTTKDFYTRLKGTKFEDGVDAAFLDMWGENPVVNFIKDDQCMIYPHLLSTSTKAPAFQTVSLVERFGQKVVDMIKEKNARITAAILHRNGYLYLFLSNSDSRYLRLTRKGDHFEYNADYTISSYWIGVTFPTIDCILDIDWDQATVGKKTGPVVAPDNGNSDPGGNRPVISGKTDIKKFVLEATNEKGVSSGIVVKKGDVISIEATGKASVWAASVHPEMAGPDGFPNKQDGQIFPGAGLGSLLMKIGSGDLRFVGSKLMSYTVQDEGGVNFFYNDMKGGYADNHGSFSITLTVAHKS